MRKIFIILLISILLHSFILPLHAYIQIPEFLCEIGIKFYQQGKYDEALQEFKKALMIQPDYLPALKYIQMIEQMEVPKEKEAVIVPATFKPTALTPAGAIKEVLDLIEIQREMIQERQLIPPEVISPLTERKISPPKILTLDESLNKILQPIEIEQGKSIIVVGKNIKRFLITQPDIIIIERKSADELLITGKDIGYTYLHVWDDNGRWTIEFLGIFPKPEGPTYEERMRREEEKVRNFKLRYSLDWSSYEAGRRIDSLERSGYSWSHSLGLTGETPYGNLDSTVNVRRLTTITDLTYFTLGLTEGKIGPFQGFTLRGFDYYLPFSNLAYPGVSLRGVMLNSPTFAKKLDYTTFWGREGGGRYGNLSPGLAQTRDSFLEGLNLSYSPTQKQNYKFTVVHGRGRDREPYLNPYDYDLLGSWNFDKWGLGYEIAYDSQTFAQLLNTHYRQSKLSLSTEFRDINKKFFSITGAGWRQGELGGLLSLNYAATEKLGMSSSLDIYRDRLNPAEDNRERWNEDFNWNANYRIDPLTSMNLSYTLQNELGKPSQSRYQSAGGGLSKTFQLIKEISTYANYYHQESKSFSSHTSDYVNDRIYLGLRFSLIGQLYYYLNKELNWVHERYYGSLARPHALETGLDWSDQLGKTPFRGNLRFSYRDEEDTVSNLSFLSGEDHIEGYSELTYRPTPDKEAYCSARVRNSWADNSNVTKRVEASFNVGMRYLWDTGIRWGSVGNIEGYVFKDLNSDGLRQRDEPPVEGVKLWLGKDKSQVTDIFGYYKFKGVKARKVYVNLDTSTLPPGFVLTVPLTQGVNISHQQTVRVDFGIISRSEISGFVFEDVDGDGEFSGNDKGIKGAVITLEDGKEATTDDMGKYSFTNVSTGEHTIALDLNSLPVYYLPKSALTKKIALFEGVTYIYNIPLKRIEE